MNWLKRGVGIIFLLAVISLPFLAWWQYESVLDWWRLRGYDPPASVVRLADASAMSAPARRIFYVNHPKVIDNISEFRRQCPQSEQTIVLGCYHSPQLGIAIFDVTDPRLNGIEEVTAAHEMLHAAYDRLGGGEKKQLNRQLTDFYATLDDERIKESISLYQQTQPSHVIDEMHSIFGSEVANLPDGLEQHYGRYFRDRTVVVRLAQGYEKEFSSRSALIKEHEERLTTLRAEIESQEKSLRSQLTQLEDERRRLEGLRASGRTQEYNAAVPGFNARVNSYNQGVSRLRRDITAYNSLLEQYNALAGELRSLYGAIDTRLTTQSVQ